MPPKASASKRLASTRAAKPTKRTEDVEDLTRQLASKLTISKPKEKQRVTPDSPPQDNPNASMRSINTASQKLSALVQTGWSAAKDDGVSKQLQDAKTCAKNIKKNLTSLRKAEASSPPDLERAALSAVGKLLALKLFEQALDILLDMYHPLHSCYTHDPGTSHTTIPPTPTVGGLLSSIHLFHLPLPISPIDEVTMKLMSTFLLYSMIALSTMFSSHISELEEISLHLAERGNFNVWIQKCSDLPYEYRDSLCTRAYSALTKSLEADASPYPSLIIKFYSLRCLLPTSSSVIKPDQFWDQARKFSMVCMKAAHDNEAETVKKILLESSRLIIEVQGRADKDSFLTGTSFLKFCDYLSRIASQTGNAAALESISAFVSLSHVGSARSEPPETTGQGVIDAAQLCTALAYQTVLLEKRLSDDRTHVFDIAAVQAILRQSVPWLLSAVGKTDGEMKQAGIKVAQAVEKLRQLVVRARDLDSDSTIKGTLAQLLYDVAMCFNSAFEQSGDEEFRSAVLDTLLVLSKSRLTVKDPTTYTHAYENLEWAHRTATASPVPPPDLKSEYLRCISGAYHTIGATLCQAERFGGAARFLQQACELGTGAISGTRLQNDGGDKRQAALLQNLYRRWEMLGVCYTRIGDRKNAHQAFVKSVQVFPFVSEEFSTAVASTLPQSLFDDERYKPLGGIIDRVTCISAYELLKSPGEISLKEQMERLDLKPPLSQEIVGVILERQLDALGRNIWKDGARSLAKHLLDQLSLLYEDSWPIRKMRILVRRLEFSYFSVVTDPEWDAAETLTEVDKLSRLKDFGGDSGLSHFARQYLVAGHLWAALHIHRNHDGQSGETIQHHTDHASKILKALLAVPAAEPTESLTSKPVVTRATRTVPPKTRAAPRSRKPPATPKARKGTKSVAEAPKSTSLSLEPSIKPAIPYDRQQQLIDVLYMVSHLLGLLGHVIAKVQLLTVTRKLMERVDELDEVYIWVCVDLAHEYVKLGRLEKASSVYNSTLPVVQNTNISISEEARVFFYLRFAESLAMAGSILQGSTIYCEARKLSEGILPEDKTLPTSQRIRHRLGKLERAAMAANAFAMIQYYNDEPAVSLTALLQALRLYNRAIETACRLHPHQPAKLDPDEDNPFGEPSTKKATVVKPKSSYSRRNAMEGLEWRICDGLLSTLFALAQAYFARGSAREAEYFAQQAQDLADAINTPTMVSRALARKGEIYLHTNRLDEGRECLMQAMEFVDNRALAGVADLQRLRADYDMRNANPEAAQELYEQSIGMLNELQTLFATMDGSSTRSAVGPRPDSPSLTQNPDSQRKSDVATRRISKAIEGGDAVLPFLLASVLRQQILLSKEEGSTEESKALLGKYMALQSSADPQVAENGLLAKLTLSDAYSRFTADMFLSSLAESVLSLPLGMVGETPPSPSPSVLEILSLLQNAEKLFWSDLALIARRGHIFQVREAALSLALIRTFQGSLGKGGTDGPVVACRLLDASSAVTLGREMLEATRLKFPDTSHDDLVWPILSPNGSALSPPIPAKFQKNKDEPDFDGEYWEYWKGVSDHHSAAKFDPELLSRSTAERLPHNWTVVSISVSEDRRTIFVSRQRPRRQPLLFSIPLEGRREGEEESITLQGALEEFEEIIRLSDETTRSAEQVTKTDRRQRCNWWAERTKLDTRLRELLENIEFCWLGAFKTILSPAADIPKEILSNFRVRLEGVFQRALVSVDKKQLSAVQLDDSLLECFISLSPKCRSEELEDVVYFVLDLYQFSGVSIAIAEVDIDQVTIDLRTALEELAASSHGLVEPIPDNHIFLILDKNIQGLPWESMPVLRKESVSRIPDMRFLLDRLDLMDYQRGGKRQGVSVDRARVDPRKTFYMLNPAGDLGGTEGRFNRWLKEMKGVGWKGLTSQAPSEQQFLNALQTQDLVLYFGHGGGEQYIRSHKIRNLPRCAATMLWGCSSGAMKDMGDFERVGTPYNYMMAGCPSLVANLWDVTDRDIDKFAQSVFDKLRMTKVDVDRWNDDGGASVVAAVAQSRDSCKLKYLTGAAPVVYGIPFYL